jgi:3-oxoacyl-[acyl-carrier protein] reductase
MTTNDASPSSHGVLVTGATGVLGQAFVRVFAEAGYFVGIHYRRGREAAEALLEEIGGPERGALVGCDLTELEVAHPAARDFFKAHPQIDTLINNAGAHRDQMFAWIEPDVWQQVLDANLRTLYPFTHAFVKARIAKRSGSVINVTSASAYRSLVGQTSYSTAKAGILGFTRVLAREVGRQGIRVNAIAPGAIRSPAVDDLPEERRRSLEELASLQRIGEPEEVARVALFLASDAASFVTGQTLPIDGGLL